MEVKIQAIDYSLLYSFYRKVFQLYKGQKKRKNHLPIY